jgi:hypothetical protein
MSRVEGCGSEEGEMVGYCELGNEPQGCFGIQSISGLAEVVSAF